MAACGTWWSWRLLATLIFPLCKIVRFKYFVSGSALKSWYYVINISFCSVVLSLIQGIALNTDVPPWSQGWGVTLRPSTYARGLCLSTVQFNKDKQDCTLSAEDDTLMDVAEARTRNIQYLHIRPSHRTTTSRFTLGRPLSVMICLVIQWWGHPYYTTIISCSYWWWRCCCEEVQRD
jgi:hypothetical protein